jgi:hypothetical protein
MTDRSDQQILVDAHKDNYGQIGKSARKLHAIFAYNIYGDVQDINEYTIDSSSLDQGAATSEGNRSLKDHIDNNGTTIKARLRFPNDNPSSGVTTYTLTTDETVPDNVQLDFKNGAIIDGAGTITFDNVGQIKALPGQQIFGSSITVVFTNGGEVSLGWAATGDGSTDDEAAISMLLASGATSFKGVPGADYYIEDTVTANNVHWDFNGSQITYGGTQDRPAVIVAPNKKTISGVLIQSDSQSDFSDVDYCGLRIQSDGSYAAKYSYFHIVEISGFTVGLDEYTNGEQLSYNTVVLGTLKNNKYQRRSYSNNATGGVNENLWIGGELAVFNGVADDQDVYGWYVHYNSGAGAYQNHNNNVWYHPCFQLRDGDLGTERVPVYMNGAGRLNKIYDARFEGGRGEFAKLVGPTYASNNHFEVSFTSGDYITDGIVETAGAGDNYYAPKVDKASIEFNSGDINKLITSYDATNASISGHLHFMYSGDSAYTVARTNASSIVLNKDDVELSSTRGVGVFVNTVNGKAFTVRHTVYGSNTGRLYVVCYNAGGTVLSGTSPYYVSGLSGTSSNFGNSYRDGSDGSTEHIIRFTDSVKFARILFVGGTANLRLKSFQIASLDTYGIHAYSGHSQDPFQKYTDDPTSGVHGQYVIGTMLMHDDAASGVASYYQCTTAGRLASAWGADTDYEVGNLVLNDTDKIYVCVTAGTSAGAGGPTGTGSGISDNTVEWDYLCPLAVLSAGPNLP